MRFITVGMVGMVAAVMLCGCGKQQASGKVELNKPVAELKAEADRMNVADLQKQADVYRKALEDKKTETDALQKKLKDLPLAQMLGSEATKIKDEIGKLSKSTSELTERLNVYVDSLKKQQPAVPATK